MGKGLRSKTKRKNRAVLRKMTFGPVEDARLLRVTEHESKMNPSTKEDVTMESVKETENEEMIDSMVTTENEKLNKIEKDRLFLSANQFKKKIKAKERSKSVKAHKKLTKPQKKVTYVFVKYMEKEVFQRELFKNLQQSGIADKLKSQLRSKLIAEISLKNNQFQLKNKDQSESTLYNKIVDSLIVGYFKSREFDFSLSVFLPESGISRPRQLLTNEDIIHILHLKKTNNLKEPQPLLINLFHAISLLTNQPTANKEIQTEVEPDDIIEWKIRETENVSKITAKEKDRLNAFALEERMLRYQQDVDNRAKAELDSQFSKFKEIELANLRVEERNKYKIDLQKLSYEKEKVILDCNEKLIKKEDELKKKLEAREKEIEKQNFELRQSLVEESKRSLLLEMAGKAEAEFCAKELKMEKSNLERKYDEAVKQIQDLNKLKDKYAQQMHEEITKYKIELNLQHAKLLSSIEIDRNKIENEKILISERQKMAEQLLNQARSSIEEVEVLRNENRRIKSDYVSLEKDYEVSKDTIRDLELKVNIQYSSTGLEFELQSLKKQLFNSQDENQKLIKSFFSNRQSDKDVTDLENQLAQAKNEMQKIKKSETRWQKECQQLVYKFDLEMSRNEDLQKSYEESLLKCKELKRDNAELKMLLQKSNVLANKFEKNYYRSSEKFLKSSCLPDPLELLHPELYEDSLPVRYQKTAQKYSIPQNVGNLNEKDVHQYNAPNYRHLHTPNMMSHMEIHKNSISPTAVRKMESMNKNLKQFEQSNFSLSENFYGMSESHLNEVTDEPEVYQPYPHKNLYVEEQSPQNLQPHQWPPSQQYTPNLFQQQQDEILRQKSESYTKSFIPSVGDDNVSLNENNKHFFNNNDENKQRPKSITPEPAIEVPPLPTPYKERKEFFSYEKEGSGLPPAVIFYNANQVDNNGGNDALAAQQEAAEVTVGTVGRNPEKKMKEEEMEKRKELEKEENMVLEKLRKEKEEEEVKVLLQKKLESERLEQEEFEKVMREKEELRKMERKQLEIERNLKKNLSEDIKSQNTEESPKKNDATSKIVESEKKKEENIFESAETDPVLQKYIELAKLKKAGNSNVPQNNFSGFTGVLEQATASSFSNSNNLNEFDLGAGNTEENISIPSGDISVDDEW
ncbi:oxidative DNA demethylase [Clydaea vesicula]|uniref:Oxidative DNA demethylase n=1 Tax=Clydaea vesicula TaxID=447962 RepID=A0AAD5U6T3_9FUNG|nr:oxidative DNA demethylase [Clydaea vesicula]